MSVSELFEIKLTNKIREFHNFVFFDSVGKFYSKKFLVLKLVNIVIHGKKELAHLFHVYGTTICFYLYQNFSIVTALTGSAQRPFWLDFLGQ